MLSTKRIFLTTNFILNERCDKELFNHEFHELGEEHGN
jgi:hypothetical protein